MATEIKILFYTKIWDMSDELSNVPRRSGFSLLVDRSRIDEVDVVIFHMPTLPIDEFDWLKTRKKNGQLWVFWSMECEAHYPQYDCSEVTELFDITMTYKQDADISVHYLTPDYHELMRHPPGPKTGFINAYISNTFDKSGREIFLKKLMACMDVHSYGNVLNNRSFGDAETIVDKLYVRRKYKFSLALENAIARDYVTEKFFHTLIIGSVPVYLGAPNINEFAPSSDCFINVNDFNSVEDLAEYLIELDQDDARYNKFLEWKELPFAGTFLDKISDRRRNIWIRLYDIIERRLLS